MPFEIVREIAGGLSVLLGLIAGRISWDLWQTLRCKSPNGSKSFLGFYLAIVSGAVWSLIIPNWVDLPWWAEIWQTVTLVVMDISLWQLMQEVKSDNS